ncbi:hypothetical protein GGI07_001152 [Coemansia sp. Benny D115]|nr:hypothetical protein GGI07_001152 [Coemansia sp. Benny D115]
MALILSLVQSGLAKASLLSFQSAMAAMAALASGVSLVFIIYRIRTAYQMPRGIPGSLVSRLFFSYAEIMAVIGKFATFSIDSERKYGPMHFSQPKSISVSDPADIRSVMGSSKFVKHPYYRVMKFSGTNSLMSELDPEKVSQRKRMLGVFFNSAATAKMEPLVLEHGIMNVKRLWDKAIEEGNGEVNYHQTFNLVTFTVVSRLVFGRKIYSDDNALETVEWMSKTNLYISIRAMLVLLPKPIFKLLTWPWEHLSDRVNKYIYDSIEMRKNPSPEDAGKGQPMDVLQALVDCEDPDSKLKLTREEIHAEALLSLVGGIDPTSFTLIWTFHHIMLNPECHKTLKKELRDKFPGTELITYKDLKGGQVPYLEACLYEAMRLTPVPCIQFPRVCPMSQGFTLKGKHFPADTTVFTNIWGSHRSPLNWENPEKFEPMRFINNPKAKQSVFAFGYGIRLCLGKHLAMMNMLTLLANIFRDYNIDFPSDYTIRGPDVLDENGNPKLMPSLEFLTLHPKYPERDCRIVVSKAN